MPREEFTTATKTALAARVCFRCSNPDCRQPTAGPRKDSDKAANIGVAAHIKAAAPGGPRYDPEQSAIERASIDNAIWLCQNCAKLIDGDEKRYDVDTLRRWKNQAEAAALLALQHRSKSEDDLDNFLRLSSKMPALIEEMAADLHRDEELLIREFVVLPNRQVGFGHRRPRFEYYETNHPTAKNAVRLLEAYGFVVDVTPRDYPIFQMTEQFVDLVTALHPRDKYS